MDDRLRLPSVCPSSMYALDRHNGKGWSRPISRLESQSQMDSDAGNEKPSPPRDAGGAAGRRGSWPRIVTRCDEGRIPDSYCRGGVGSRGSGSGSDRAPFQGCDVHAQVLGHPGTQYRAGCTRHRGAAGTGNLQTDVFQPIAKSPVPVFTVRDRASNNKVQACSGSLNVLQTCAAPLVPEAPQVPPQETLDRYLQHVSPDSLNLDRSRHMQNDPMRGYIQPDTSSRLRSFDTHSTLLQITSILHRLDVAASIWPGC